jgi:hypothetical protein
MSKPMPQIVRVDGRPRLLVDGEPFLILGLQWACESCFHVAEMNPLFAEAARLCCNTAVLPLYWREVEPELDRYDMSMLDERLARAREHGLRLVLLWFATWKNAHHFYAPDYIRGDPVTYPLALNALGEPAGRDSLCPSGEATWKRDRRALLKVMEHLREADGERTVILFQVENEPGLMGTERCYCPACHARFESEGWERDWGPQAAEAYSVASVSGYIDRLAAEAHAVYPLPFYQNVWLGGPGRRPGRDYPAGGAVEGMLGLARSLSPHLDLIGPDVYGHGYRTFSHVCEVYGAEGNPLYIAEHSSSLTGRAERNVFYAIGEHGAIGFDPWAIDSPFPERSGPPLVDRHDLAWGPQAGPLRDSYLAIGRATLPMVEAQGTPRLYTFVQEAGESGTVWCAEGVEVLMSYAEPNGAGRGMAIQLDGRTFLLLGVSFTATFQRPYPSEERVPVQSVVMGAYEGERWIAHYPVEGHRAYLLEPGVARVTLG